MSEHELWNELGNLYFLAGQYQQAVHAYRRSIQLDRAYGRPYSNLALTFVQQGRYEQAIELFQQSIELLRENREKALSWNRLGNVFRHLKDYRQAVLAYRNADELDPDGRDDEEQPGWAPEPSPHTIASSPAIQDAPLAVGDPFPYSGSSPQAVGDSQMTHEARESTATWAPLDPSLFQQDTFEALEPRTLTTWGDPSADADDHDADWPPEPGTDVFYPEIDSDDLSRWLPIPEERPVDELEYSLEAVDLASEAEEPLPAPEVHAGARIFADIQPEPPDPIVAKMETKATAEAAQAARREIPVSVAGANSAAGIELDVMVDARPDVIGQLAESPIQTSTEVLRDIKREDPVAGNWTAKEGLQPDSSEANDIPADPQRDPVELQEIEAGLAKFRRVVQVNPKNARAWDTIGNLHKSAGQYTQAIEAYQMAIKMDGAKALYHHHLGLVYACEGRMDEAIDAFQSVIQRDPGHALAHAALGGYYRKKGLDDLAQKHIGIAMKSIYESENEYNRACLAAICGNTEQALELLRVALTNKQTYVDWILRDPDLDFIRMDPRFKQLVSDFAG